jgi:hypothetical protein
MPYFIIIPIWLVVLVLAGGLAFIPDTRRVATYIAVCSTSALVVSVAVSTLAKRLNGGRRGLDRELHRRNDTGRHHWNSSGLLGIVPVQW